MAKASGRRQSVRPALVPGPRKSPRMTDQRSPLVPGTTATREALLAAATAAGPRAYAAYSRLHVGAAILSGAGRVYAGCNVENAAYPLGACAEAAAISAGVLAEGAGFRIVEIAVWAAGAAGRPVAISPCGGCRQRILEFATSKDVPVHFNWPADRPRSMSIGELLPCAFELSAD